MTPQHIYSSGYILRSIVGLPLMLILVAVTVITVAVSKISERAVRAINDWIEQ